MTRRTIVVDSEIWKVYPTGRITVYGKDEFGLLFELGTGPERRRQPKLILPINGDAARGINLPDLAVYYDGASCHQAERLRGREYNPESLSEAENLQPQPVIRAPVTASFTAIARVRHHRREIARCC